MNKIVNGVANDYEFDMPPVSAYGSVDLNELLKVMERLNKVPNFDELLKDNNKKDKEIARLNKIIERLVNYNELVYKRYDRKIKDHTIRSITKHNLEIIKELKEEGK